MTIRYGLIGAGMMGQEHIRNLNLLEDCRIVAVVDPDDGMRRTAVELAGSTPKAFTDYKELLSSDSCDALIVATPNDTHHAIMLDALETNKPILCEKPLCTTSEHCWELIKKAKNRDAPVWVAMEYRYMPPVQRLLAELKKGMVGTVRMLSIREHRFPFLDKVGDWNRFSERTGDTLIEKCCHFWDLMRLILNSNPTRIFASAGMDVNHLDESYNGRKPDISDNAFAIVEFEGGTRAMLDLCMFAEGSYWQEVISVTGDKARIDAKVPGSAHTHPNGMVRLSEIVISDRKTRRVDRETIDIDLAVLSAGSHHGSTFYQHVHFKSLIRNGGGKPEVDLLDGLWSIIVGEAANKSSKTGQSIDIESV